MNIKTKVDHIIVGQGLAGSCLAIQLINRGKKVIVFDEPGKNRASIVAAGLFNPVTGKRMSKSWKAEEIFPYLFRFYSDAEKLLGQEFLRPRFIYRPFVSIEEQNEWMGHSEDGVIKNFIERIFTSTAFSQVKDPLGGILIKQSGYLEVNSFLRGVRDLLKKTDLFYETYFNAADIQVESGRILYKQYESSTVIFCEGFGSLQNLFFSWVPVRPLKGETLSISIDLKADVIFNRGVYLVPGAGNLFTVGATHIPNDSSAGVSEKAKTELEEKLNALMKIPFQVDHQNWGIRPTTPDRRPILGAHPLYKNVVIFNGLGTKGVSLAPYFSAQLAEWLEGKGEIHNEVNIERFKPLYSKFSSL